MNTQSLDFTHRSQHALALPDGTAAAKEANHHDNDANDDEGDGATVQEVEVIGALHILLEVLVNSNPDSHAEQGTSHQLQHNSPTAINTEVTNILNTQIPHYSVRTYLQTSYTEDFLYRT